MTTKISSDNIQSATLAALTPVTITQVQITDSSWTVLDDSAVSTSGGYIVVTGNNFQSGCNVIIDRTNATSVTFVNSTTLRVQVPAMSAGTYVVYVTNTNGGTAIIVNGLTYSGTPTWVTTSPLAEAYVETAISIQLSVTGDAPFTYALQAGSSLPSGLTLSSSGLLSGSVTGLTNNTTYNFTIVASDLELQDSPKAFAITIISGDTYWDYVTTLLSASTPTTLPFNDDASTNNFTVTINGDTKPNNFNPYTPGYYSNYFNGGTNRLTTATSSLFNLTGSDITLECWVYMTAAPSSATNQLITIGPNGAQSSLSFAITTGRVFSVSIPVGGSGAVNSGSTLIPLNAWTHLAFVLSGTTGTIYIDGAQVGQTTTGWSITSSTTNYFYLGYDATATVDGKFTGYVSNARLVVGTAVYTSAFTPPTSPLTEITNTRMLTSQSNRFIDNSANNFTITKTGDVKVNSFDPFVPNSSYNTYGSTYFDGTGDSLSSSSNLFATNTSTFTIEGWVYPTTFATLISVIGDMATTAGDAKTMAAEVNTSGQVALYWYDGAIKRCTGNTVMTLNAWNYFAIVVNSNAISIYVNKTTADTLSGTTTLTNRTQTTGMGIGAYYNNNTPAQYFTGYLSDLRVSYTNRTISSIPSSPLTSDANTRFLSLQSNQPANNNVFLDNSTNNFLVTRNGNTTQGTFSPYGENWSNYFDGTGDYLSIADNAAFDYGTGNFTVEFWMYPQSAKTCQIYDHANSPVGGVAGLFINFNTNSTVSAGQAYGSAYATSAAVNLNTWYHVAVVRSGTAWTIYINGTSSGTGSSAVNLTATGPVTLGGNSRNTAETFQGYISNFRIVKGTAVYTGNFTPSTTPLLPVAGTSLLTCQSPNLVDDSANNFAITKNGDVSVQKFGPFAGTTLPTPYYSGYFNGTSTGYASYAYSATRSIGTGDFSIECWINVLNQPANYTRIWSHQGTWGSAGNIGVELAFGTVDSVLQILICGNSTTYYAIDISTTPSVWKSNWAHVVVTRQSGTLRAFLNGVMVAAVTGATTNINGTLSTAFGVNSSLSGDYTNTYVSNFRMCVGAVPTTYQTSSTAANTSVFTAPTSPLTTTSQGASNVVLLAFQSNTFIDNSSNNFAITATANSKPMPVSPFSLTYSVKQSYTPSMFGGSMYFDGTGDYLNIASTANYNLTGNFTIELWFYDDGSSLNFPTLIGNVTGWSAGSFSMRYNNTGQANKVTIHWNGATPADPFIASAAVPSRVWHHVAFTRSGSTCTLWVDGISQGTGTYSTALNLSYGGTNIGWSAWDAAAGYYKGYVSDVRVTNGQALYTSSFVPQNAPLTAIKNSLLLVNGTSAGIYDSSEITEIETVADTKLSTAVTKYGTTSMYFDGTGDYMLVKPTVNLEFGSGDFTIEFWLYRVGTGRMALYHGSFGTDWSIAMDISSVSPNTSNTIGIWASSNGTSWNLLNADSGGNGVGTIAVAQNTWTHIAYVRSGTTWMSFVNGVKDRNITGVSGSIVNRATSQKAIGAWFTVSTTPTTFNGYISDFRVTKGYARYTENFTPAASSFISF